jgi:homoserine kinase type II
VAVYTDVGEEELAKFLASYDLGALLSYKGIAEGVENTNYLLHTTTGYFFLTLYEKRVARDDLPFFLGLMEHLARRGIICPQPVKNKKGEALGQLAGKPAAIVTFLEGVSVRRPNVSHCSAVGRALAQLHLAGNDFKLHRKNALALSGWEPLARTAGKRADEVAPGLQKLIAGEIAHLAAHWPTSSPTTCSSSATSSRG